MLTSDQIEDLNSQFSDRRFFEAMSIVRNPNVSPTVTDYLAHNPDPVVFEGNTYQPLPMRFVNLKADSSHSLPVATVNFSNIGNLVVDYIEDDDNGYDVDGNDVTLMVLAMDRLGRVFKYREDRFQVLMAVDDQQRTMTLYLGLLVRFNDPIPFETIERNEFPALRGDVVR